MTAELETAAGQFKKDVEGLWQDGKTLTLIHADLHDGNIVFRSGEFYIIDWGQARYGSFYLDLPNLFSHIDARSYYKALLQHGISINEKEFFTCYRKMGRYVGFKYLGFVLSHWASRNEQDSWVYGALENLIDKALHGAKIPDTE